jgi:hypothetical protein
MLQMIVKTYLRSIEGLTKRAFTDRIPVTMWVINSQFFRRKIVEWCMMWAQVATCTPPSDSSEAGYCEMGVLCVSLSL